MLRSNAFCCIVDKPTRVTTTFSILLYFILNSDTTSQITPDILKNDLNNHFPTFVLIKNVDKKKISALENRYYTCKTTFNLNNLLSDLQEAPTPIFRNKNDVDHSNLDVLFDRFLWTVNSTIDLHASLRQHSRKQRPWRQKPWITNAILKSVKLKQKLYFSHFINQNNKLKQYNKKYSNLLTRSKKRSKHALPRCLQ